MNTHWLLPVPILWLAAAPFLVPAVAPAGATSPAAAGSTPPPPPSAAVAAARASTPAAGTPAVVDVDWDGDGRLGSADADPLVSDIRGILDFEVEEPVFRYELRQKSHAGTGLTTDTRAAEAEALELRSLLEWRRPVPVPEFPAGTGPEAATLAAGDMPGLGPGDWGGARVTMPGTGSDAAAAQKRREDDLNTARQLRDRLQRPRIVLTLVIHNGTASALDCRDVRVPLLVAGRVLAQALPVRDERVLARFTAPPGVCRQLFVAPLSVEAVDDVLATVTGASAIRPGLDRLPGAMVDMRTGRDLLPVALLAEKACLRVAVELPNGGALMWWVARRRPGLASGFGEGVTVRQVLEAVSQRVRRERPRATPVFRLSPDHRLVTVFDLDNEGPCLWDLDVDHMRVGPGESLDQGAVNSVVFAYGDRVQEAAIFQAAGERESARQKWSQLAEVGHMRGVAFAGLYEFHGWGGIRADRVAGLGKLLTAAAAKDVAAMNALGVLLCRGEGMVCDPERGRQWLSRAAEAAYPAAEYNLGCVLAKGMGAAPDVKAAVAWLERALQHGCTAAAEILGDCYAVGLVPPDHATAAKYYRTAALAGRPEAQFAFGLCCLTGRGVAEDPAAGNSWIAKAAAAGSPAAQRAVGLRAFAGAGISQDFAMGLELLRQAAAGGDSLARQALFVLDGTPPKAERRLEPVLLFW